jgi:hypothetical protein
MTPVQRSRRPHPAARSAEHGSQVYGVQSPVNQTHFARRDAASAGDRHAMSQREQRTNEALRALDEAHRLGRIQRDEYRRRRRALLESLRDANRTDSDTVRRAVPADGLSVKGAAAPHHDASGVAETIAMRVGRAGHARRVTRLAVFTALLGVAGLGVALACWLAWPSP